LQIIFNSAKTNDPCVLTSYKWVTLHPWGTAKSYTYAALASAKEQHSIQPFCFSSPLGVGRQYKTPGLIVNSVKFWNGLKKAMCICDPKTKLLD